MGRTIRPMSPWRLMLGLLAALSVVLTLSCEKASIWTPPTQPTSSTAPTPPMPTATVTHTLTITASPSCTVWPEAAKRRTYPAQLIEQSNGDLLVRVVNRYDIMIGWANDAGFTGKRDGNTVRFDITNDMMGAWAMIERIPGVGDMGYIGTATGTTDNGRVVATFNGRFQIGYGSSPLACQAPDHRLEMVPTGS